MNLVAIFIAILALWVSIDSVRKSNRHIVKILGFGDSILVDEKCISFYFLVQNIGIPIIAFKARLSFYTKDFECIGGSLALYAYNDKHELIREPSSFLKGQIVKLELRSNESFIKESKTLFDKNEIDFIVLDFLSGDYKCYEYYDSFFRDFFLSCYWRFLKKLRKFLRLEAGFC
jgi:hypothetical protein